jgi:hypothetical protein
MAPRKFLINREDYPVERKGPGRPRGSSAQTLAVKEAVKLCAKRLGGVDALFKWVKAEPEHETIFWRDMYMKLLPIEIESRLTITHEEALDDLERRFPRFVDGKPVKYLDQIKAPHIEEN